MGQAYLEAKKAYKKNEVPVGTVIVRDGEIIGRAHNLVETRIDATAHSELLAIQEALKTVGNKFLLDCQLYTTLEPCSMCAGAIVLARLSHVFYGAYDEKRGFFGSVEDISQSPAVNHRPKVISGLMESECSALLSEFFAQLRKT